MNSSQWMAERLGVEDIEIDMTPTILLEKIIEKAVRNGYCPTDSGSMVANISADSEHGCWFWEEDGTGAYWEITHIIFYDSSFAKAYFGEEEVNPESYGDLTYKRPGTVKRWQYHIGKLALTPPEERLSYLGRYI